MSGKLGSADLAAAVDTVLYTCPAGKTTTLNVNLVNRGTAMTTVRVAIGTAAAPVNADYIEYETAMAPSGVLERTAVVLSAGEKLFVRAAAATVSARAHGFEEIA